MANIAHPQSGTGTKGTNALIYAPPPSTATHTPNASLFAPSSNLAPRFTGNANTRSHSRASKPVYPERFHQRYALPVGIEEQPF